MGQKVVSVIITTYGARQEYLKAAIDCVKNQTYKNIELIVVDDNGRNSDQQRRNEELVKKYDDIHFVCNAVNSGVQFSRNNGLLNSGGEYVAFLDDDDLWVPEKIEKQVTLLEREKLGMVFCNGVRFKNNDFENVTPYQKHFISNKRITFDMELANDRIGSTSIPLIRRECFNKAGIFDINLPARQDYDMWIRICRFYDVKGIDEVLFYYRFHDGERITKSEKKSFDSHMILWKKYKKDFCRTREAKANVMLALAMPSFKMRSIFKACWYTLRALAVRPLYTIKFVTGNRQGF